jgi:hypothetical protein
VETLKKLYVHNIKEILAEPIRRFPYAWSALSTPVTYNENLGTVALYKSVLDGWIPCTCFFMLSALFL